MAVHIADHVPAALEPDRLGARVSTGPAVRRSGDPAVVQRPTDAGDVRGPADSGAVRRPGDPGAVPPYLADLRRAEQALLEAELTTLPADRYLASYLAAMRTAVTVLAVRARPRRTRGPADVWQVLAHVAPELGEWAAFFAAGRQKRLLVQAGATTLVTEREADDLLRDAQDFHALVARRLTAAWRRRPREERPGP